MATKSGEIEIFQFHIEYFFHTLWVKNSVEIALSLTVSEILTFFVFPQKFKMAAKVAKIEIFQLHIEYSTTTMRVKISVEMALSLTVSEILTFLGFPQKSKMAAKSGEKIEIFQFCIGYFAITLRVKNSVKITLSLAVSEILTFSVFRKNPRWPPISHGILFPYPVGQKFCRNRSISYGFQDINIFCFSAKIQDGRKSGEN